MEQYEHSIKHWLDAKVIILTMANVFKQIIPKSFLTFSSFFAVKFGVTNSQMAWLVNVFSIANIFTMLISAHTTTFIHKVKIRHCIILALCLMATLFLIQAAPAVHRSFVAVVLVNVVAAHVLSITFVYFTTVLGVLSTESAMGTSLSIFNSAWGWVTFLSPAVGAILYRDSLSNFFIYFSSLFFFPIVSSYFCFPEDSLNYVMSLTDSHEVDRDWTSARVYELFKHLTMTMTIPCLLVSCLLGGVVSSAFYFSLARFLHGQCGFNSEQVGIVFITIGVSEIVGAFISAWVARVPLEGEYEGEGRDAVTPLLASVTEPGARPLGSPVKSVLAPTAFILCVSFLLLGIPNFLIFWAEVYRSTGFSDIVLSLPFILSHIFFFTLGWELFFTNILVLFLDMGAMTEDSQSILLSSYFLLHGIGKTTGVFSSAALYDWHEFGAVAAFVSSLSFLGFALLSLWITLLPKEMELE